MQARDTDNIGNKTQNDDKQSITHETSKDEQHGVHQKHQGRKVHTSCFLEDTCRVTNGKIGKKYHRGQRKDEIYIKDQLPCEKWIFHSGQPVRDDDSRSL